MLYVSLYIYMISYPIKKRLYTTQVNYVGASFYAKGSAKLDCSSWQGLWFQPWIYNLLVPIDNDNENDHDRDSFKRPGVDKFLEEMSKIFELVLFAASSSTRANMVMSSLFDPDHFSLFSHGLSRGHCLLCSKSGLYVKDLSLLGRELSKVILIDDNPLSYELQPFNAIPIKRFRAGDNSDNHLTQLIPFLQELAQEEEDVCPLIRAKYHDLDCVVYAPPRQGNLFFRY